ncbi:MAG: alpha/beta fold hydrolase [Thiothrix sp.]|nr:alpha/beta fold hydrolase [Thiothrix sp.]
MNALTLPLRLSWRLLKLLAAPALLAGLAALLVADHINRSTLSPPRRALQVYQLERLQQPQAFGLRIRVHGCLQGQVPCLLVEPEASTGPGERGRILRRQLADRGIRLPGYGRVRGTLVLLHGRNGRKESLLAVAERFAAAGFRSLIPDLPGHGDSPLPAMSFGSSAFERTLPQRILADARNRFRLPPEPAALWGLSMGGAVAVSAASADPRTFQALIVTSSFARLDQVMLGQLAPEWRTPASLLLPFLDLDQWLLNAPGISRMMPEHWAAQVRQPTLVVHGERDRYVPLQQGQALYAALASPCKRWLTVPGGGHANVLATGMPLYAEMSAWLLQQLDRDPQAGCASSS